ncbi:hypothetical protein CGI84_24730 [Vibrio parahaemolyticus]|nr:hypothetical protein CGI84_24730 [Vibrio parahaemolyticus]
MNVLERRLTLLFRPSMKAALTTQVMGVEWIGMNGIRSFNVVVAIQYLFVLNQLILRMLIIALSMTR